MTNRWTTSGWLRMVVLGCLSAAAPSCGDDDTTPPLGLNCVMNSECKNPLSCSFGFCHAECNDARDCAKGETCIIDKTGDEPVNVCQLSKERGCVRNSDCDGTLVCASDFQCRNQCEADKDCATKTQKCVEKVCAEPEDLEKDTATGDYKLKPGTPPAGKDAGTTTKMDAGTTKTDAGTTKMDAGTTKTDAGTMMTMDAAMPMMDSGSMPKEGPADVEGITVDRAIARQGEINLTVTVKGKDLGNPVNIKFGDLKATLKSGATDTQFEVSVSIPHGAALGTKDFSFQSNGGSGGKEKLVTVSEITSAADGKDTNRGSSDNPFRTYKKALSVADKNDTVLLKKGMYNVAAGEDWMMPIPEDVIITGEGTDTKLVGPGSEGGSVNVDGFTPRGNATIKNLSLGFFRYNAFIDKPSQKVSFENVELTSAHSYNLYVTTNAKAAELKFKDTNIIACDNQCMYLGGESGKLDMTGGKIASLTSYGLSVDNKGITVNIDGTKIEGGGTYDAVYTYQLGTTMTIKNAMITNRMQFQSSDTMMGSLTLENTTVDVKSGTNQTCLLFSASKLTVKNSKFLNGYYGIQQQAGEATIRKTQFTDYVYYGIYITAGKLDLGTETESGDNAFSSASGGGKYGIYDSRQLAATSITVSGTSFNDYVPPAKTEMSTSGMYVDEANRYRIATAGNSIVFY